MCQYVSICGVLQTAKDNSYEDALVPGTTFVKRSDGSSMTEGIGIDRITANFAAAKIDGACIGTDVEASRCVHLCVPGDVRVVIVCVWSPSLYAIHSLSLSLSRSLSLALSLSRALSLSLSLSLSVCVWCRR